MCLLTWLIYFLLTESSILYLLLSECVLFSPFLFLLLFMKVWGFLSEITFLITPLSMSSVHVPLLRFLSQILPGLPGGLVVKSPPTNAGDEGLIPGLGRCPGEGNGNPLLYSCLKNPTARGAWWATVHGVTKSWM